MDFQVFELRVAAAQNLVDLFDGEMGDLVVTQGGFGKGQPLGLENNFVHDDVSGDIPKHGVCALAANYMAQGGVEKFMDEHTELFGRRVLGHELGIEEEAASIRRRRLDILRDDGFREESERCEEG